jgi:predicted component of viral defense system (DUF524 family)
MGVSFKMSSCFLVFRAFFETSSFKLSITPSKVGKQYATVSEFVEKEIRIDSCRVTLIGVPSESMEYHHFPLIYQENTTITENLQALEQTTYRLEMYEFSQGEIQLMPPFYESATRVFSRDSNLDETRQSGTLNWGSYVGASTIAVKLPNGRLWEFPLEIRAKKINYLSDYRFMIDQIIETSADLIWSNKAPTHHAVSKGEEFDPEVDLLGAFFYIKAAMSDDYIPTFWNIISESPSTVHFQKRWITGIENASKIDGKTVQDIITSDSFFPTGIKSPSLKLLRGYLPETINVPLNYLSFDTPENRFVKYWIAEMVDLLEEIINVYGKKTYVGLESYRLIAELKNVLTHQMFLEVPHTREVNISNLGLRRKPGYSGMLQTYEWFYQNDCLNFEPLYTLLFAKRVKPVYKIYEIWVLFQLIEILKELGTGQMKYYWKNKPKQHLSLEKVRIPHHNYVLELFYQKYHTNSREEHNELPSYSTRMNPDYTLVIRDASLRVITAVVLDAKYKYDTVDDFFVEEETEDDDEQYDEQRRIAKRADLLTVHAYKDAIQGVTGAYVIYPGTNSSYDLWTESSDELHGIGAFPLYPSAGSSLTTAQKDNLKCFINRIVDKAKQD